jgi:hypothetical protein
MTDFTYPFSVMEPLTELKNFEGRENVQPRSASREKALAKGERTFQEFKQRRLLHRCRIFLI